MMNPALGSGSGAILTSADGRVSAARPALGAATYFSALEYAALVLVRPAGPCITPSTETCVVVVSFMVSAPFSSGWSFGRTEPYRISLSSQEAR
jgi:hypothetical protein